MLPVKQPPNGVGPGRYRPLSGDGSRWQRCYWVSLTLFASAILATLVTFGVLNFLLNGMALPPISTQTGLLQDMQPQQQQQQAAGLLQDGVAGGGSLGGGNSTSRGAAGTPRAPTTLPPAPRRASWDHAFDDLAHMYSLADKDASPRCAQSKICDGDHSCGPDKRGCITAAKERQSHVRQAIAWAWEGYRKYAWGHDEVDVLSKSPHAWFNLGLTIVDSLDTLLIAGLMDEYQEARHWVANHLYFHDGSTVQFFEVNIRILGGLVSAYYLSDGDDLYLHKAEQLADRLMVAFNTSSGMPVTHVALKDAAGRRTAGNSDAQTNIAEAGTISMEFTSIGRLLGRDDMFDAGMQFWYVLMSSKNISGLYCMGIHTSRADCYNPQMTIGSAADSTYEYMLKQWVLSNHTQQVPRLLYEESMKGVRKYLVRHVWDGDADMSIVTEARADMNSGVVFDTNNRFEHLTCFAGGMFVLGALHNLSTELDKDDFHDVVLGARIGRACYELYHQTASGLAPDSVTFKLANGQPLGPRENDKVRPPGTLRQRPGRGKKQQGAGVQAPQKPEAQPAGDQLPHDVAAVAGAKAPETRPGAQQPTGSSGDSHKAASSQEAAAVKQPAATTTQPARRLQDVHGDGVALRQLLDDPHAQQHEHHLQQPHLHLHHPHAAHAQHHGLPGHHHTAHRQLHESHHAAPRHSGRQLLQVDDEAEAHHHRAHAHRHLQEQEGEQQRPEHAHSAHSREVQQRLMHEAALERQHRMEVREQHRRMHADGERPPLHAPREEADARRGDPPARVDAGEAAKAVAERRAAEAAQHERLAAQQRERAEQDAAEHLRRDAEQAAKRRHAEERQQAAAHQQQAAHQEQHVAQQEQPKQQAAQPQQEQPKQQEPPKQKSPPPPPPPAGPQKTSVSQLTAADFLRPETIETLFYLWRATGDEIYREWGWNMFRAFEHHTRLPSGGYATITNVNSVPPGLANKMESFFVAETLKYFYLLFEDDPNVLPLDEWVFNTEAHPLPIWGTAADSKAMELLKQRRLAAKLLERQHSGEDEAFSELQDIKRQGAELAQRSPQKGKPQEREGYGLGGLEMF